MTLTTTEHEILINKTMYNRVEYVYEHKCKIHLSSSSTWYVITLRTRKNPSTVKFSFKINSATNFTVSRKTI